MGFDRFVYWDKKKKKPSDKDLRLVLSAYISTSGKVDWKLPWVVVTLKGKPSFPFQHLYPRPKGYYRKERFFEVYIDPESKYVDVITRQADEFTSNIAEGYAQLLVRQWGAKYEK